MFELFIPILFFLFFVPLWCFVMFINSVIGGWQQLAKHYRHELPFNGEMIHMQSARIRISNYSGVLTFGLNETGLYLRPFIFFRPFHPPLLIPWYELNAEPGTLFLFSGYRLTTKQEPNVTIFIYERLFSRLEAYLDQAT